MTAANAPQRQAGTFQAAGKILLCCSSSYVLSNLLNHAKRLDRLSSCPASSVGLKIRRYSLRCRLQYHSSRDCLQYHEHWQKICCTNTYCASVPIASMTWQPSLSVCIDTPSALFAKVPSRLFPSLPQSSELLGLSTKMPIIVFAHVFSKSCMTWLLTSPCTSCIPRSTLDTRSIDEKVRK